MLVNGNVYKYNCEVFTLVFFGLDTWGMLHICEHVQKDKTAPMFKYDIDGRFIFSIEELESEHNANDWELLKGKLDVHLTK